MNIQVSPQLNCFDFTLSILWFPNLLPFYVFHNIVMFTYAQVEDVEGERLESSRVSIINLVDLAGSERVAAAQSQGDRLKVGN